MKSKGNRSGELTFRSRDCFRLPHDAPFQTPINSPKPLQLPALLLRMMPVPAQWLAIYCTLLVWDFTGWTSGHSKASDLPDGFTPPCLLFIHPVFWPPLAGSHQLWAKTLRSSVNELQFDYTPVS